MKQLQFNDIYVEVYTDAKEFTSKYFDLPEGAIVDETSVPDSAGFANITDKRIAIFVTEICSFEELLSTVAHELGHLIENGFKKNPPQKPRYDKRHEQKAEHYENFVINSYKIAMEIYNFINVF